MEKNTRVRYYNFIVYEEGNTILQEEEKYFKFYFFESGFGSIKNGEKTYSIIPPCILCLSEKETLTFRGEIFLYNLYFHPAIVNATFNFDNIRKSLFELKENQQFDIYWLLPFLHSTCPVLIGPTTGVRIKELLHKMSKELTEQKGTYWPCRSRSFLYELLNLITCIIDEKKNEVVEKNHAIDPEIQEIIHFLHENYHKKITIPEICELFSINRTTLSQRFKKNTGKTIMNYLTTTRVRIACTLLRDTSLLIYEIMHRVGYEDTTHFGRAFRKHTGKTPSEYRQEYQQK